MKVVMLGTSGAIPTLRRMLPAAALQREGDIFLFDCGEGTQMQLMKAGLSPGKIEKIFISHLHGDHVVGLPGLLMSLGQASREKPLFIYGPRGIKDYILTNRRQLNFYCPYKIVIKEIKAGKILEEDEYRVEAITLDHNHFTLGYALIEKERPGKFLVEAARALGIEEGPLFGKLQQGETIKLKNGKVIRPSEVLGKPRRGRKVIYAVDTRPSSKVAALIRGADLLIHDGMFSQEEAKEARERGHSTVTEVARMAKEAGVKKLVLTHLSARYPYHKLLQEEARKVFPNAVIARDLLEIEIPLPRAPG